MIKPLICRFDLFAKFVEVIKLANHSLIIKHIVQFMNLLREKNYFRLFTIFLEFVHFKINNH